MKKRLLFIMLATVSIFCLCLGISACNKSVDSAEHIHTFTVENVCSDCGRKWTFTEGLSYALNEASDTYTVTGSGTAFDGAKALTLVIPYGYQGKPVTKINDGAFNTVTDEECGKIESLTISNSVTEIGNNAFSACSGLRGELKIPDSVTEIGEDAFSYCSNLTSVTIGRGVIMIGSEAFRDCDSLTNVVWNAEHCVQVGHGDFFISSIFLNCKKLSKATFGESAKIIPAYTFDSCSELTSVTIGSGVTEIGISAFFNCRGLTSVTIGSGVTEIGNSAFDGCSKLTSIMIPDSVTEIGYNAFSGCSRLASVTIGSGVTEIGISAFFNCNALEAIYYKGTDKDWKNILIDNYGGYNDNLYHITRYYYTEDEPEAWEWVSYSYWWHYDPETSQPTPWAKENQ